MNESSAPQAYFLYKLIPPRPTFDEDMTEEEGAVMGEHVSYWGRLIEDGTAIVFGPVGDPEGVWGLGVLTVADEDAAQAIGRSDPAVLSGVASFAVHPMPATIVGSAGSYLAALFGG